MSQEDFNAVFTQDAHWKSWVAVTRDADGNKVTCQGQSLDEAHRGLCERISLKCPSFSHGLLASTADFSHRSDLTPGELEIAQEAATLRLQAMDFVRKMNVSRKATSDC